MAEITLLDFLKQKSILVTGGAGFIGSNIAIYLSENQVKEVRILDNLSTGNKRNIEKILRSGNAKFIEGDIRIPETCLAACDGIDVVLHQAALGSVQRSIVDPSTTNSVNVDGFLNMLVAAKEKNVKRFVYASSSSVYGDDKNMPKKEELTGNLLSPYAVSKKTNEEYAKVFSNLYGMEIIGLRYFNVFGPNQDVNGPYAAVIPLFIKAILDGKQAVIFGDGENSRDFTYVSNVVRANLLAAFVELKNEKNPVINIAYGGTTSINQLHKIISEIIGNTASPSYASMRSGDIKDSFADISKAKNILGYAPLESLEEGLKKTVEWWKVFRG